MPCCAGRGAQRKGCGNMVPYGDTQIIVATQVFMTSTEPHRTRHWVEGELYESEISYVKQGMREAIDTEEFAKLPELQEKLTKLRGRKVTKGHWYYDDTGMTVGGHISPPSMPKVSGNTSGPAISV